MGRVAWVAYQSFLVREACVSVLVSVCGMGLQMGSGVRRTEIRHGENELKWRAWIS